MTTWDPDRYLQFAAERERPFDELLNRVPVRGAADVVDLGCGPGTATRRLLDRWPEARVVGVDNSAAMLARAAAVAIPGRLDFVAGDVRTWSPAAPVDVVLANAVLQWVPGHAELFDGLLAGLRPGGALAFQVPANFDSPIHTTLRHLATSGRWDVPVDRLLGDDPVLTPAGYLERLRALGAEVDVWETTYLQVLRGADAVLEWARGTALRPVLSALEPAEAAGFEAEYGAALRRAYPPDAEGATVLAFRRIFAVALRPA